MCKQAIVFAKYRTINTNYLGKNFSSSLNKVIRCVPTSGLGTLHS